MIEVYEFLDVSFDGLTYTHFLEPCFLYFFALFDLIQTFLVVGFTNFLLSLNFLFGLLKLSFHAHNLNMKILGTLEIVFRRVDDFQLKLDIFFFLQVVFFILFSQTINFSHSVFECSL